MNKEILGKKGFTPYIKISFSADKKQLNYYRDVYSWSTHYVKGR